MGKRHSAFTGLSRFALEVFGAPQAHPTEPQAGSATVHSAKRINTGQDDALGPPQKKRKTGLLGPGYERLDATGLVPYYTDASEVPNHLRKYFFQRERYFSLYSSGCLLDEEGWYSVTPELIANQIAERCRCGTIVDAFCGVGGNTIAFAQTCERVIAIDTSPVRLALARHNAAIYGVEDRVEFILADYRSFLSSFLSMSSASSQARRRKIDVVFLSPPWGGPEYISGENRVPTSDTRTGEESGEEAHPEFSLASIRPMHGAELFRLTRRITPNIAYFLPRNANLEEISALLTQEHDHTGESENGKQKEKASLVSEEIVEVEEEWMGSKLKALTCYFGGLATGQEHMFEGAA